MSVMTAEQGAPLAEQANQQQWVKDTGRESLHWAVIPQAYRGIPGIEQWANDPNIDPYKDRIEPYLNAQRAAAPAGTANAADQGDAQLLLNQFGQQPAGPAAPAPSSGSFTGGTSLGSAYAPYTSLQAPTPYQPYGETFQAPEGTMDQWGQTFTAPTRPEDLDDPWGQTFKFDASDLENDEGYQFLQNQGIEARKRAAAAGGYLNNPGLANELEEFGQGLAATHLGDVYNRQLSTYGTNYDTFSGDRSRRSGEADKTYNEALGAYNTNYGTFSNDNAQRFNQALQGYQTRAGVHDRNEAGRFGSQTNNWTNSFNQGRATENDAWDRQFRVADYGLAAAGGLNNASGTFGAQGSDIMQNQGNATAAGQVGAANAWGNTFGNIADYGQTIPYLQRRLI